MAYDVTEERLKVKGSEQITRDLKVNRDAFINGKAETGSIDDKGDLKVAGEILAGDDVTISGDLYVNGTEYINDSETAQTTDNYLVLRHNQTTPLGTDEYSGVAVHNYASGKTATITTDKDGTWRVADNTETDTNYTDISYYNGTYYTGLTRTAATVISGMKTAFDEDELDESVYYNTSYYHFDGNNWFPVSLVDNKLTLGSAVTDSTTITALNALTKEDLVYFRALTITVINPVENQPVLTRAESSDLTGGQALTWDATNQKAVGKTIDTTVTANSSNLITSGGVYSGLAGKVDKETGKGLSTNDFTTALKDKLDGIEAGAEVNVQADWNQTDSTADDYIRNKPVIPPGVVIDTAMSDSSAKAVENRVIKAYVDTAETNAKNLANATGTLAIAHGGTGATTALAAEYNLIGAVQTVETEPNDDRYIALRNQDVSATNGTFRWTKMTSVWNYIKSKISSVLGLTSTAYGGKATTAGTADQANKGKNGSTYSAFGSNAFNSTAFATSTAVSLKMDKANPTGTGSFSLNRKANTTIGTNSFAEGTSTMATGENSHAEGGVTTASGENSHAEGFKTIAKGDVSHAEGTNTSAMNVASHAEGSGTTSSGEASHAEGWSTTASGPNSHAEGRSTTATGETSHAEGRDTIAKGPYQHVQGKYNVANSTWAFVIGGGSGNSDRKNILAFDWDGNLHIFGDIYVHCNVDGTGGIKK